MKSLDIGTAFLVKGELDIAGQPTFTVERNAFLEASATSDTEDTLKENNWAYAKHGNQFFILGEDAIKLKNLLTMTSKPENQGIVATKIGNLRRPMKDGILNTAEEKLSIAIIQRLISNLLGPPSEPGEILCFCAPADPVDRNLSALFHKTMLTNFLTSLGYTVDCIPEALSIIFSERPVADDPDEPDGKAPFTGISISCGGGMMNVCLAIKKMPLIGFSIARSGDFIDEQAAKTAGIDVAAMTRYKEKHLDLSKIDYSDIRQAALDIYYQNVIEHALTNLAAKFNSLDNKIDTPLEIVVAGGTASVPGFITKFQSVLSGLTLPFKVKNVRLSENPFYTVANGCLIKAISLEQKKSSTKPAPVPPPASPAPPVVAAPVPDASKDAQAKKIKLKN